MPVSLTNTFGVYIIGTFLSLILYGISVLQTYKYARAYPNDKLSIRLLVVFVMFQETVHSAATMHTNYYYLVTNYYNVAAFEKIVWSLAIMPLLSSLLTFTSQIFFARRVSLMGPRYKILAGFVGICLIVAVVLGIMSTSIGLQDNSITTSLAQTKWLTSVALLLSGIADFVLSTAIIVNLPRNRKSDQQRTTSMIDLADLYILNTGLLTAVVHIVSAITAIVWPHALIWGMVSVVVERLYGITLLSVLNSRKLMVSRGLNIFGAESFGRSILARAGHIAEAERWNVPRVADDGPTAINIKISAEVEVDGRSEDERVVSDLDRKGLNTTGISLP